MPAVVAVNGVMAAGFKTPRALLFHKASVRRVNVESMPDEIHKKH